MKITVYGIVQGVGFRPTVYRVAKAMGLRGYVLNNGSNAEVHIDRDPE
ncbi:MAG: acylphosphatase, partial [Methanomassiliicoccales archaeon]|nr:acylphosphatase [Methanomassiliicoccales archaeon]